MLSKADYTINNFWDYYVNEINKYMPKIIINNNFRTKELKYVNDHRINLYRGIYEHVESETGGPFFVYEFKNKKNGENFLFG